jgi:CBS domain-containing protein
MQQWQISDVMTTDVVTATPETSVSDIAGLLAEHRISAVPIIADDSRVLGIVSETDLMAKLAGTRQGRRRRSGKAAATDARGLMSRPAVSVASDAPLASAVRKMRANNIKRLLVTDDSGALLGVVSRGDLARLYARPDDAIRQDVIRQVLRRTLWIGPSEVQVEVNDGVVTLTGDVGRRTTAEIAARLTGEVPGVVSVVNGIRHEFDDTELARSRPNSTHPFSAEPFAA